MDLLPSFLLSQGLENQLLQPLAGDASGRQYYRLTTADGRPTGQLVMDVKEERDSAQAFKKIAALLSGAGLAVPTIFAASDGDRYLLIEDFGDAVFAALFSDPAMEQKLVGLACEVLITLQQNFDIADPSTLPVFDQALFAAQADLLPAELLLRTDASGGDGDLAAFQDALQPLLQQIARLPNTLMLRDYHAENLIWLPERQGVKACGLLDFQDAGIGPIGYDLVSLLEDARRDIDPAYQKIQTARYRDCLPVAEQDNFSAGYEALAVIRHLRVIAVFLRLARLGKPKYLKHLPRIWRYLENRFDNQATLALTAWLNQALSEEVRQEICG
jgi:aminoglycoside/choline kinase family phosphotransferase